jgi:hypothetical protein
MTPQLLDLHVNPADEAGMLGQLGLRFLVADDASNGSVAVIELLVPGAQRLSAPAHRSWGRSCAATASPRTLQQLSHSFHLKGATHARIDQ